MDELIISELEPSRDLDEFAPYLNLWVAVVNLAITDLEHSKRKRRAKTNETGTTEDHMDARTARHWILDESPRPAGFVWVCELFGVDPVRARSHIIRRTAADDAEPIATRSLDLHSRDLVPTFLAK